MVSNLFMSLIANIIAQTAIGKAAAPKYAPIFMSRFLNKGRELNLHRSA
jgi:hypothetical protein